MLALDDSHEEFSSTADSIDRARALAGAGKPKEAIAAISATCQRWPEDVRGWIAAADFAQSISQMHAADRLLEAATAACPASFELFQRYAGSAEVTRDWPAAVARWTAVRERWPDHWAGFTGAANALLELRELDAAVQLLAAADQEHPEIFWVQLLRARVLTIKGDLIAALPVWRFIRDKWPDSSDGYFGGTSCLRQLGRHDEADAIIQEGVARLPTHIGLAIDFATLAEQREDWAEADKRWRMVRQRFPNHLEAYFRPAARATQDRRFDDAEIILAEGMLAFPDNADMHFAYARVTEQRDGAHEASQVWQGIRQRFAHLSDSWQGEIAALKAAGLEDVAQQRVMDAAERFPTDAAFVLNAARAAAARRALDEALAYFAIVREKFPRESEAYHVACALLRQQNRFAEAEAIIELGLTMLPDDPHIGLEYAWCGNTPDRMAEYGLAEGVRRLERLRAVCPAFNAGYILGIHWLRSSDRQTEAKQLADDAIRQFPDSIEIVRELSLLELTPAERTAWIAAFQHGLTENPNSAVHSAGLALMLMGDARPAEAETALERVRAALGPAIWIATAYAECAEHRDDWAEAIRRWEQAELDFPGDARVAFGTFRARTRLADKEPANGTPAPTPSAPPRQDAAAALTERDLMMQFESLGADPGGCEFGLIQREFKAEPLGLLRWATISAADLTMALDRDFAGVGDPDNTELTVHPVGTRSEYSVADRRYGMMMHTFVYTDEVAFDKMFQQICRRLAYLRRKLLDDLAAGEKIFVWRQVPVNLSDAERDALHAAMRRHGDNTLLYVRYDDEAHPSGSVELVKPGLLVGYVDRFITDREGKVGPPATQTWLQICRNAYTVLSGGR